MRHVKRGRLAVAMMVATMAGVRRCLLDTWSTLAATFGTFLVGSTAWGNYEGKDKVTRQHMGKEGRCEQTQP